MKSPTLTESEAASRYEWLVRQMEGFAVVRYPNGSRVISFEWPHTAKVTKDVEASIKSAVSVTER